MDGHGNHVPGVVRRHETARPALHPPHAEGDGIVLIKEPLIEIGGGAGAALFVAVGQEVLEQRGGLPVFGVVTLHALDERHGESPGEKRVLAVALLVAAPADVAAQVGVGRPDDQGAPCGNWCSGRCSGLRTPRWRQPHGGCRCPKSRPGRWTGGRWWRRPPALRPWRPSTCIIDRIPSRGTPGRCDSNATFSSNVIRETMLLTRSSRGRLGF